MYRLNGNIIERNVLRHTCMTYMCHRAILPCFIQTMPDGLIFFFPWELESTLVIKREIQVALFEKVT